MKMNFNLVKEVLQKAPSTLESLAKSIPWQQGIDFVKGIKPRTWLLIGSPLLGVVGGVLLRQPKINKLTEQNKKYQSENERLHLLIDGYHEQFVAMRAKVDALQAKEYADQAKEAGESARSVIMYQYAAKEYIELSLRPRGENGVLVLPEKEYNYYIIFKRVLGGEMLEPGDAKKLQNYIYPKYRKQIEGLIEFDFSDLLQSIPVT